eukprot:g2217.t1
MGAKQSTIPERDPRPERKESKSKYRQPMVPLPKGHRNRWEEDQQKMIKKRMIDERNSLKATRPYRSTQFKLATDDFYRLETSIKHDDLETFRRTYHASGMEINDTPYCRSYNIDGFDYQEVSLGNGHKAMMGKSLETPYLTQKFCKTCLHFAATRSAVKISSWLVKEGAFISMKTHPEGKTAKDLAGSHEIDRIFRRAVGGAQSDSEYGSWICSLCTKRNPGSIKHCAVCGRSSDHVPTRNEGNARSGAGSPSVRTLLSGRLPRFSKRQESTATARDSPSILNPTILSAVHSPAPSPKHSFRSPSPRFPSPSPTSLRGRGDADESLTNREETAFSKSRAGAEVEKMSSSKLPNDDSVAALLLSDYYKRRADDDNHTKLRTSKVNLLRWASEGDEARVLRGDYQGNKVRIVTVISGERALVQILPVVVVERGKEEKYVELHRNNLHFVGPWQCKVCSKANVERENKCGICGRPRGHKTPGEVIERVWIPRAIKVGAAAAAAKSRSPKHSNAAGSGASVFSKAGTAAIDGRSSSSGGSGGGGDGETSSFREMHSARAKEKVESSTHDDATCCVCLERASEYAFVPCGHKCVCKSCGDLCEKCPKCRKPKGMLIRIFGE